MKLYKEVTIVPAEHRLSRDDEIVLWGSCFADELREHLYAELYRVEGSPYGIMYNPLSMAEGMQRVLQGRQPEERELFYHQGEWHSPLHHGCFSHESKEVALEQMRESFTSAHTLVERGGVSLFVFTFGTSWVYEWAKAPHKVVNNCHRLPSSHFRRRRLSVEEIVAMWQPLLTDLLVRNPYARMLFTVSPICHYRNGAHESRLSKSALLLAIDQLQELFAETDRVGYFPAYEIQLDELRDYRFFKEDFAHPTPQAVVYILRKFADHYLEEDSSFSQQWSALKGQLQHRPLTTNHVVLEGYYEDLIGQLQSFATTHPHPYLDEELSRITNLLAE